MDIDLIRSEKKCLIFWKYMVIGYEELERGQEFYDYGIKAISASATAYFIDKKFIKLPKKLKNEEEKYENN